MTQNPQKLYLGDLLQCIAELEWSHKELSNVLSKEVGDANLRNRLIRVQESIQETLRQVQGDKYGDFEKENSK